MQFPHFSQQSNVAVANAHHLVASPTNCDRNTQSAIPETRPQFLLSLKQVSARCALSRSTIYLYIKYGRFPKPYPIGMRAVRFLEKDIEAWIEQQVRK